MVISQVLAHPQRQNHSFHASAGACSVVFSSSFNSDHFLGKKRTFFSLLGGLGKGYLWTIYGIFMGYLWVPWVSMPRKWQTDGNVHTLPVLGELTWGLVPWPLC